MYRLLETIKLSDGVFKNLYLHTERLNRSRRELGGCLEDIDLQAVLTVPPDCRSGVFKYRLVYGQEIISATCTAYHKRPINSLKVVIADNVEYAYKFENRENLLALWEKRADCDEILIVKANRLTDTSFSNLAFFTGRQWLTPHRPLLPGTKRAQLLAEGLITEAELVPADLKHFKKVALINAMLELGECVVEAANIW